MKKFGINFKKALYWPGWVVILLGIFFLLNFFSAQKESLTYDEPVHLKAGVEEWRERIFSLDANNPPLIRELAALPIFLGVSPGRQYLPSRVVIIFLGSLLGFLIFRYAKENFGYIPALISLFLFAFEPNFLAHSHYVTLDVGTAFFFFLGYWWIEKFLKKQTWKNVFLLGIFTGLTFASKITVIPVFLLVLIFRIILERATIDKKKIVSLIVVCLFTIWAVYLFSFSPIIAEREDPNRLSVKIINFATEKNLDFLKNIVVWLKLKPLPLGYFLATLKNGFVYNLSVYRPKGVGEPPPFFNGSFFPLVLFLKLPLSLIFLIIMGIITIARKKKWFLFFPFLVMILIFSVSSVPSRIRYLLPVFPFLIIIAGLGGNEILKVRKGKIIVFLLLIWYAVGCLSFFPHFISYTNELGRNHLILSDSNYDWGQSLIDLTEYVKKENISIVKLSYFGTDQPENYGLVADTPFEEKFEERCPLHLIRIKEEGEKVTAISLSNWYFCGYWRKKEFAKEKIAKIVGRSILIFK